MEQILTAAFNRAARQHPGGAQHQHPGGAQHQQMVVKPEPGVVMKPEPGARAGVGAGGSGLERYSGVQEMMREREKLIARIEAVQKELGVPPHAGAPLATAGVPELVRYDAYLQGRLAQRFEETNAYARAQPPYPAISFDRIQATAKQYGTAQRDGATPCSDLVTAPVRPKPRSGAKAKPKPKPKSRVSAKAKSKAAATKPKPKPRTRVKPRTTTTASRKREAEMMQMVRAADQSPVPSFAEYVQAHQSRLALDQERRDAALPIRLSYGCLGRFFTVIAQMCNEQTQ